MFRARASERPDLELIGGGTLMAIKLVINGGAASYVNGPRREFRCSVAGDIRTAFSF